MKKLIQKRGFTMMELLIAVAIVAVLLGIGVYGVMEAKKSTNQKRLDEYAEIIYSAAQSRLTELRMAGHEREYRPESGNGVEKITGGTPSDLPETDGGKTKAEFTNGHMCYLIVNNGEVTADSASLGYELMPSDRNDETLNSGSWVIEFNYNSGAVYSVFFAEADNADIIENYSIDGDLNSLRDREKRLKSGKVGYYGGGTIFSQVDTCTFLQPQVQLTNAEMLSAEFICDLPDSISSKSDLQSFQFSYTVYELSDSGDKVLCQGVVDDDKTNSKQFHFSLILDNPLGWDPTKEDYSGKKVSFYDNTTLFGLNAANAPEDRSVNNLKIELTAIAYTDGTRAVSDTDIDRFNNLFGEGSTDTKAELLYPRHLQNLNNGKKEEAELKKPLEMKDVPFTPLKNESIKKFNGNKQPISDLTVKAKNAGLFEEIYDTEVKDVTLVDPKMTATSGYAGALAATISGDATITGCQAYLDPDRMKSEQPSFIKNNEFSQDNADIAISASVGAGGLVGRVLKGKTANFEMSSASLTVSGKKYAGGLIGLLNSDSGEQIYSYATINKCYADSYTFGQYAGGLIGHGLHKKVVDGKSTYIDSATITNSYAAGYLFGTTKESGIGYLSGNIATSYTTCEFLGSATSTLTTVYKDSTSKTPSYYRNLSLSSVKSWNKPISDDNANIKTLFGKTDSAYGTQGANAYNLLQQYSEYPSKPTKYDCTGITGLEHYGDWGPLGENDPLPKYAKLTTTLTNAEKLALDITLVSKRTTKADVTVTYDIYEKTTSARQDGHVTVKAPVVNGAITATYFDDLSASDTQFATLTAANIPGEVYDKNGTKLADTDKVFADFFPGCYLEVVVSDVSSNYTLLDGSVMTDSDNSLFSDRTGNSTAHAICGRHLQNLDKASSGVDGKFNIAKIDSSIAFGSGSPWQAAYGASKQFNPIRNSNIDKVYGLHSENEVCTEMPVISDLSISGTYDNYGLFGFFGEEDSTSRLISGLTLENPTVNGSKSTGALVGDTYGVVTIENCTLKNPTVNVTGSIVGYEQTVIGYEQKIVGYEQILNGYEQKIVGYEQKIVGYEQKIIGYNQKIVGYEQKITGYEQKIDHYVFFIFPVYTDDLTKPIYGDDTSKPIYGDDTSSPIYADDTTKPIYGDDTSKPIYGDDTSKPIYTDDTSKPIYANDTTKPIYGQNPIYSNGGSAGGFIGESLGTLSMTGCAVTNGTVSTTADYAGGLIGKNGANTTLASCSNTAASKSAASPNVSSVTAAGGLVGITADGCTLTVTGSSASAAVESKSGSAGGFIGESRSELTITNCTASTVVGSTGGSVGGFIGESLAKLTMTDCTATDGIIATTADYAGGLIGKSGANATLTSCSNTAASKNNSSPNVSSTTAAGGLVGITADGCKLKITSSSASAVVGSANCKSSGGLIGRTGTSDVAYGTDEYESTDFVLVVDMSDSMWDEYSTGETKLDVMKSAVKQFISDAAEQTTDHRIAIAGYNCDPKSVSDFKQLNAAGVKSLNSSIDSLDRNVWSSSWLDYGFEKAYSYINNRSDKSRRVVVIVYSDGYTGSNDSVYQNGKTSPPTEAMEQAAKLKAAGATIYCIGAFEESDPAAAYTVTNYGGKLTTEQETACRNALLHFVSSDYDSTCTDWSSNLKSNDGRNKGYYFSSENAAALQTTYNAVLKKASPQNLDTSFTAEITDCQADCNCIASDYAAGLVGWVATIPVSLDSCTVTGTTNVATMQAGLAVCPTKSYVTIKECTVSVTPSNTAAFKQEIYEAS